MDIILPERFKPNENSFVWWFELNDVQTAATVNFDSQGSMSAEIKRQDGLTFWPVALSVKAELLISNVGWYNLPDAVAEFAINDFAGYNPTDEQDGLEVVNSYGATLQGESSLKVNVPANGHWMEIPISFYPAKTSFLNVYFNNSIGYNTPDVEGTNNWQYFAYVGIVYMLKRPDSRNSLKVK